MKHASEQNSLIQTIDEKPLALNFYNPVLFWRPTGYVCGIKCDTSVGLAMEIFLKWVDGDSNFHVSLRVKGSCCDAILMPIGANYEKFGCKKCNTVSQFSSRIGASDYLQGLEIRDNEQGSALLYDWFEFMYDAGSFGQILHDSLLAEFFVNPFMHKLRLVFDFLAPKMKALDLECNDLAESVVRRGEPVGGWSKIQMQVRILEESNKAAYHERRKVVFPEWEALVEAIEVFVSVEAYYKTQKEKRGLLTT